MKKFVIAAVLALALFCAASAEAAEKTLTFSVMRKGSEIGTHVITIKGDAQNAEVTMKTRIAVKILFVTAYTYTFDGRESWKDGKLVKLSASVNDDGARHDISAEKEDGKLMLTVDGNEKEIDNTTIPSSWWNKSTLKHKQLIDLVTGKVQDVDAASLGPDEIEVNGKTVTADSYSVEGGIPRTLWYTKDGTFARMSFTKKGDQIEYIRR